MTTRFSAAVVCLASLLNGCDRPHKSYESPPLPFLKEYPDYAEGRHFEIEGTPRHLGSYSYSYPLARGAIGSSTRHVTRHVYKVGEIFVDSDRELTATPTGIRGLWKRAEHLDQARKVIPDMPEYVLSLEKVRETRTITDWK
jgi:hypothetical protein